MFCLFLFSEATHTINEEDSLFVGEDILEAEKEPVVAPPPIPRHTSGSAKPQPKPAEGVATQHLPAVEEVHQEIKSITLCIQELLRAGQSQKQEELVVIAHNGFMYSRKAIS